MNFVPLRDPTARVIMRAGLQNFIERIAHALAINLADASTLARSILDEPVSDDDSNQDGAS